MEKINENVNIKLEHPELFGDILLKNGFRKWCLYMFRVVEKTPFIEEELHEGLFDVFEDIYNQRTNRNIINVPPRAGKTTLAKYFIAYCLARNPKCNFIYTSYSQSLLTDVSMSIMNIIKHPIYEAMYDLSVDVKIEEQDPIDEFWKDIAYRENKKRKTTFTVTKWTTPAGGTCLFASVGASITGFGAGIRGAKEFSGALICDDANKPADIHSEVMRKKVRLYYVETLLTRLNDSGVAIINIQQRLHRLDLSGCLISDYKFHVLKKSLIVDGICQLPKQYDKLRLIEIQVDQYMFEAQYQQNPMSDGGTIFDITKFVRYDTSVLPQMVYRIITGDTAMKDNKKADFSVLQCWGLGKDGRVYLIDQVRGKWLSPELKQQLYDFWGKHNDISVYEPRVHGELVGCYIEDKVSGTYLIQEIMNEKEIPIEGIERNKEGKVLRAQSVLTTIYAGYVCIPKNAPWINDYLQEFEYFSRDDSHAHDDQIDPTVDGIRILRNAEPPNMDAYENELDDMFESDDWD